jgi:hypothetical protein
MGPGIITTIAGYGTAPSANVLPSCRQPAPVQLRRRLPLPNGNIVIADQQNNRILQLTLTEPSPHRR